MVASKSKQAKGAATIANEAAKAAVTASTLPVGTLSIML